MKKLIETSEYAPYYSKYINDVPQGDIIDILAQQNEETISLLLDISENQAHFRYAPEKWTLKEVIGHMADTEQIMGYRLLSIARGEIISLPGFNENDYVRNASFNNQTVKALIQNLSIIRQSTIHLLQSLTSEAWGRKGLANNSEVTVRALAYIIAGHELHHRKIITGRYINSVEFPSS
ncbi:MAG: hypothetical protein K0S25_2250, partial [Bacillus sp. (in: firmicutes)]|nr:hypothetical protein [Bacillus sp. (in: firmicutes)]